MSLYTFAMTTLTSSTSASQIKSTFVVTNRMGDATPIEFNETFWTELQRKYGNFAGYSLISSYSFDRDWDTWERHPYGDEFVCLITGQIQFVLEDSDGNQTINLCKPGEFLIVPRGIWHTAKIKDRCTVLFLTPGQGTEKKSL